MELQGGIKSVVMCCVNIAANIGLRLCDGRQSRNLIINRELSGGYYKTAVSRWPFSQHFKKWKRKQT
jgi:hypothetical protein